MECVASRGDRLVGRRGAVMPMCVVGVVVAIRHGVILPRRGIGDVERRGYLAAGDGDSGGVRIVWRGAGMPMPVVGVVVALRRGVILPRRGIGDVGRRGYFATGDGDGDGGGVRIVGRRTGMPMHVTGIRIPVLVSSGVVLPRLGAGDAWGC